jgi:hypothetical protein
MIQTFKKHLIKIREIYRNINPLSLSKFDVFFIPGTSTKITETCLPHTKKNIKKESLVVFFSSRNNYKMLTNEVLKNTNFKDLLVFNIDDNSLDCEKKIGREICEEKNIIFIENEKVGLQWGLKTLTKYLDKLNYKANFILHMTHDNYPLDKNFKNHLENIAKSKIYNNFGLVGFNHLDYRMTRNAIKLWKKEKMSYGLLGRIFLSERLTGENWYNQTTIYKNQKAYKDVFSVECVSDMAFLINRELFSRHIKPSSSFKLHLWADDIALQFMKKNIYNAVDRRIFFFNCQEIKRKYGISVNSVDGAKNNDIEFNTYGDHLKYWEKKWGFSRNYIGNLNDIKKRYKNTIIHKYINHSLDKGPLKNFL